MKRSVELYVNFRTEELKEKRVIRVLDRHLTLVEMGTFLRGEPSRDLYYEGKLDAPALTELRKTLREIRSWKGMTKVSLRIRAVKKKPKGKRK